MEKFATDTAPNGPYPAATAGGSCGCSGGGRRRHRHTRKGGVGMVDDALFAVGTSYAADKYGRKAPMGGRRRTVKRGGAGLIDDAIVAGSALTLAHYFAKKRGGKKPLPRRLTKKTLV